MNFVVLTGRQYSRPRKLTSRDIFRWKNRQKESSFTSGCLAPGMDIYELRVRINKHAAQELTIHLSIAT